MNREFFITATGTDIGKSFYLQKLCREFKARRLNFSAIKPIISGFNIKDENNDSALILKALDLPNSKENLNKISPWRFKAAVSPNVAARLENKKIDLNEVINFCQNHINLAKESGTNLLIEGAGGIMTPINNKATYLDLMKALNIPVILVTGNYLGTISHTLTALEVLYHHKITVAKIILNCKDASIDYQQNLENLQNFTGIEIEKI